jgi:protein involved in polysaccharide export with SLBB domain
VRRPGILEFRSGISIEDYIKEAGGYSNRAWKGKVRVTRSVTGQTLLAKDVTSLDPGDFVWVPEKPDRSIYQPFRELLTTLALMSTIVIAVWTVNN